jgi:hypothetical protein
MQIERIDVHTDEGITGLGVRLDPEALARYTRGAGVAA